MNDSEPRSSPPAKTFLGMTQGDVTKAVLAVGLGVAGTLLVGWLLAKSPHLLATVGDIIQFRGDKNQFCIFNVSITNDGSKEAEDVQCSYHIKGALAEEVKLSPDSLNATVSNQGGKVSVKLPLMNPGETLQISALVSNATTMEKPEVAVRGKGFVGEIAPHKTTPMEYVAVTLVLVGLMVVFAAALVAIEKIKDKRIKAYRRQPAVAEMFRQIDITNAFLRQPAVAEALKAAGAEALTQPDGAEAFMRQPAVVEALKAAGAESNSAKPHI